MPNEPIHPVPTANAVFLPEAQTFWRDELPSITHRYFPGGGWIVAGGLHATAGTKVSAAFATEAITEEGNRLTATGSGGTASIDYGALQAQNDDTCWVIISNYSGTIQNNFVRAGSSNYFVDVVSSTRPALPNDSAWLMQVTLAGGAITAVQDLRLPSSYMRMKVYDVTDPLYGAVGDGVANDLAAILRAFAGATGGNKAVLFPGGIYELGTYDAGSPILIDLRPYGDNLRIITMGKVEITYTTPANVACNPYVFYLYNNNHFWCDEIYIRNKEGHIPFPAGSAGNVGGTGFYLDNDKVLSWGDCRFRGIYSEHMLTGFMISALGTAGPQHATNRIRNVTIDHLDCRFNEYGFHTQNDGDNVYIASFYGEQNVRSVYVYGSDGLTMPHCYIHNPARSSGQIQIVRNETSLYTRNVTINAIVRGIEAVYATPPVNVLVAITHVDLLGGEISGVDLKLDVQGSAAGASYKPVHIVNYDAVGGAESTDPSVNIVRDIRLAGSCDLAAQVVDCVASYAAIRQMHFITGYNFLPDQSVYDNFQLSRSEHDGLAVWTAAVANPVLGDGTCVYHIDVEQGIATLTLRLDIGATTTTGTGAWTFSGWDIEAKTIAVGSALFTDAGTAFRTGICTIEEGTDNLTCTPDSAVAFAGSTVPFTWAAGDYMIATVTFPIAGM